MIQAVQKRSATSADNSGGRSRRIILSVFAVFAALLTCISGPLVLADVLAAPKWVGFSCIIVVVAFVSGLAGWYLRNSDRQLLLEQTKYKALDRLVKDWTRSLPLLLSPSTILRTRTHSGDLGTLLTNPSGTDDFMEDAVREVLRHLTRGLEQLMPRRKVTCQYVWSKEHDAPSELKPLTAIPAFPEAHKKRIRTEARYLETSQTSIYHYVMAQKGQGLGFNTFDELSRVATFDPWPGMERSVQSGVISLVEVNGKPIGCLSADCPQTSAFPRGAYLFVRFAADVLGVLHQISEFASDAEKTISNLEQQAQKLQAAEAQIRILQANLAGQQAARPDGKATAVGVPGASVATSDADPTTSDTSPSTEASSPSRKRKRPR